MSKEVLITRDENQAQELVALCESRGLLPIVCPLIKIIDAKFSLSLEEESGRGKVIVFTSKNSVRSNILSSYPNAEMVAVGEQTAKAIRALGVEVALISSREEEISLGVEVCANYNPTKYEIVLFQGNTASGYLEKVFLEHGYRTTKHLAYEVVKGNFNPEALISFLKKALVNSSESYVTLLSRYTAEQFVMVVGELLDEDFQRQVFLNVQFLVIGQKTASYLREKGAKNVYVSPEKSLEGLITFLSSPHF